jgi:iron complex outermembrane receptor protein
VAGGKLALNGDVSYSSSFYHNLRNFDSEKLDGRTLGNASVTWSAVDSGWRVSAFVRNITDERYQTIGFDSAPNCGCSIEAYGLPRTYGVTVGARF